MVIVSWYDFISLYIIQAPISGTYSRRPMKGRNIEPRDDLDPRLNQEIFLFKVTKLPSFKYELLRLAIRAQYKSTIVMYLIRSTQKARTRCAWAVITYTICTVNGVITPS